MAANKIYIGDNEIGLENLKDADDQAITDATVTASLFKKNPLPLGSAAALVREIQILIPNAKSTAGTFKLGYHGDWTGDLAYDAALATIEAALEALDGIGADNVVVGGKQLSDADFAEGMTFTFARRFGEAFLLDFDFDGITGPTQNDTTLEQETQGIAEGVAVDLGGTPNKVIIPIPNMVDVFPDGFVKIIGSRNYDGEYAYDPLLSTKGRIVIEATFAYEEFSGDELAYIGLFNGKALDLTHDTGGNYYGMIPNELRGIVAADTAQVIITATSGGTVQQFRSQPAAEFYGDST